MHTRSRFWSPLIFTAVTLAVLVPSFASAAILGGATDIIYHPGGGVATETTFGYEIYANVSVPSQATRGTQYSITVSKADPGTGLVSYANLNCYDFAGDAAKCEKNNARIIVTHNGATLTPTINWDSNSQTYTVTAGSGSSDTISVSMTPSAGQSWGSSLTSPSYPAIVANTSVTTVAPPINPPACTVGGACTSAPNSCGMTNTGTYNSSCICSAATPSNASCPPSNPPSSPPVISLWWDPTSVAYNGTSVVRWYTDQPSLDVCDYYIDGVGYINPGWPNPNTTGWSYGPLTQNMTFRLVCRRSGLAAEKTATVVVGSAVNNAACNFITAPTKVAAGEAFVGTAGMANTGSKTWNSDASPHRLGAYQDNPTWGLNRVGLPVASVSPGGAVNFSISATAPSAPGTYTFNWKMVEDNVEWFPGGRDTLTGACTANISVQAISTARPIVSPSCPYPGTSHTISISNGANNPPVTFYALRVNSYANGWDGTCSPPDLCPNVAANASGVGTYTFNSTPGQTYEAWAHPCVGDFGDLNSCNWNLSAQGTGAATVCQNVAPVSGSCSASPTSGNTSTSYTWTATPSGGNGTYTYSWSGTDALTGTTQSAVKTYPTAGTKTASVTITSGGVSQVVNCSNSIAVSATPNLTAGGVSPTSATAGTPVTLSSTITNSGTASTGAGFTNLFQKANDAAGTGAADIGTHSQAAAVAAAGTASASLSYTFPVSDGGTTKYVRACADKNSAAGTGTIAESNEGDNCGAWTAIVVASPSCANGANNPPTCNACTLPLVWNGSSCVACNGGCGPGPTCNNGASNPPSCSTFRPTATLSANPTTVDRGQASTLTWNSTGATSCTGVGFTAGATSGSVSTGPLNTAGTQNYQLTCSGAGGTSDPANASVTVLAPFATISANPQRVPANTATTITWTSGQVTSCAVTGPGLSSTALSSPPGGQSVTITAQSVFRITCQTNSTPVTSSVLVNVLPIIDEF